MKRPWKLERAEAGWIELQSLARRESFSAVVSARMFCLDVGRR